MSRRQRYLPWSLAVIFLAGACATAGPIEPAPSPRRPKEVKTQVISDVRLDCDSVDPRTLPPSVTYKERSIVEAKNLAEQGVSLLVRAEDSKIPRIEREVMITESVDLFITSLRADPYNVHATYNLAAAYARIGRGQCAVNLLERLVELRKLPSQKAEVDEKLDRLLGRGKYRRRLDPDFRDLRDTRLFREVIKKFCPSLAPDAPLDQC